jgi:hypothetical protein
MGAFDQVANITVPDDEGDPIGARLFRKKWGWDAHEVVIMRGSFSAGDQEAVGNASMQADKKGNISFQGGSGRIKLLERMIVDWTLAQNGRKVEVTPQAIKRLPANYSNPLLEKCDELASAMTEEEQDDFFGSAVDALKDAPEGMKIYPMRS